MSPRVDFFEHLFTSFHTAYQRRGLGFLKISQKKVNLEKLTPGCALNNGCN